MIRIIGRNLVTLCLFSTLAGCTVPEEHPSLLESALPPMIPAHRFAYQGDLPGAYQLSPDGQKLAWIGPYLLRSALFVRNNESGEVRKYRGVAANFQWTSDSQRLLYASDSSGGEDTHVYMIDLRIKAAEVIDLTPFLGVKASVHQLIAGDPDHVLIRHNRRDRRLLDLYRVNLNTRAAVMIAQNPGDAVLPVTANDGRVIGWQRSRALERAAQEQRRPLKSRRPSLTKKPEESFRVLSLSPDGSYVWALSNRGRDRVALVTAHPNLGWEKVIFEDSIADVTRVVMSRVTGNPLTASALPGYPRDEILDPSLRRDLAGLLAKHSGQDFGIEIVSKDYAERKLILSIYTSSQRYYYLIDRNTQQFTHLGNAVPPSLAKAVVPVDPIKIDSRDGMQLHGYLALPHAARAQRLPTVILVHGGPWARTSWSDPLRSEDMVYAQFLANRGYAVVQINFRGSAGYGHRYLSAGMGEFAGKMQEDLLDVTQWAIDAGIADPTRVAIMGWSYGGYASLVGLTTSPETYACGVSLSGPTDLASLIESFPPYWSVDLTMWHDYVGDPSIPEDRYSMTLKSPLTHAKNLQNPVLIAHGTQDVRVRLDQAVRMVETLKKAGKPVEYLEIPEMGHGVGYWVHQLKVLRATEDFLHRCLGGRTSRLDSFDILSWLWTNAKRLTVEARPFGN